jgi:hypothetical protein
VDTGDDPLGDPLLHQLERIMAHDIPDPNRRRAVALIAKAHMKTAVVRVLRETFDPYLTTGAPDPGAAETMRNAIISVAGYNPEYRWAADPGNTPPTPPPQPSATTAATRPAP